METSFQVAVALLAALAAAVAVSALTPAIRGGPSVFLQAFLAALVAVQLVYLYKASTHQLQQ
jgi:hypothetical protein